MSKRDSSVPRSSVRYALAGSLDRASIRSAKQRLQRVVPLTQRDWILRALRSSNEAATPRQHASTGPATPQLPEPTYAERVRTLLSLSSIGTLSTLSRKHIGYAEMGRTRLRRGSNSRTARKNCSASSGRINRTYAESTSHWNIGMFSEYSRHKWNSKPNTSNG